MVPCRDINSAYQQVCAPMWAVAWLVLYGSCRAVYDRGARRGWGWRLHFGVVLSGSGEHQQRRPIRAVTANGRRAAYPSPAKEAGARVWMTNLRGSHFAWPGGGGGPGGMGLVQGVAWAIVSSRRAPCAEFNQLARGRNQGKRCCCATKQACPCGLLATMRALD